jgi:hypothetical protein
MVVKSMDTTPMRDAERTRAKESSKKKPPFLPEPYRINA